MFYRSSKSVRSTASTTFIFCLAAVSITACGPTDKLTMKGVDISTREVGGSTYISMEAIVLMGNLQFPNIEVPVMNPSTLQSFGQMALQHLDDGSNRISVMIDYTEATKLDPALGKTLPNGREVPTLLGAQNAGLIGIPVLDQSRVYVGGQLKKELFIGAAIAVPAFDSVVSRVPIPLNLFFNFPFSAEVTGVGGLFTGPSKGQNGIAIFVKKSITPTGEPAYRILASVDGKQIPTTEMASVQTSDSSNEIQKMDRITLFRLNRLLNKHAIVRVK
jgi:hypothetical protein